MKRGNQKFKEVDVWKAAKKLIEYAIDDLELDPALFVFAISVLKDENIAAAKAHKFSLDFKKFEVLDLEQTENPGKKEESQDSEARH